MEIVVKGEGSLKDALADGIESRLAILEDAVRKKKKVNASMEIDDLKSLIEFNRDFLEDRIDDVNKRLNMFYETNNRISPVTPYVS